MQEKKLQPLKVPFKKTLNDTKTHAFEVSKVQKQMASRRLPQMNKGNQPKSQQEAPQQENIEFLGKTTPQSVSLQILKDGYADSYVDFFYITNNCMIDFLQGVNFGFSINSRNENQFDSNEDNLNSLMQRLTKAEEITRYPDKSQAFEEYIKISEMFEQINDYLVAAYFYKKVMTLSKLIKEFPYYAKAKLGFARCYDRVGQTEIAIKNFEDNYAFCLQEGLDQTAQMISRELIELYHKIASSYEQEEHQDIPLAIEYYDKCLQMSEKVGEVEAKGSICHKVGLLYSKLNDFDKSISYQKQYLDISSMQTNPKAKRQQMDAHSQIAKCYMKIEQFDEAQSHLESYYSIAKDLRILNAQSDSALLLATLFQKKDQIQKSLEFYQQHFNCAREEKPENGKDRNLIDKARVIYGIAKANANYKNFVKILKDSDKNLKPLLEWKLKKE